MLIKDVERQLQNYDSALRIRWSNQRGRWSVERRVTNGHFNVDRPYSPDSDRYYHVRDGYLPIGTLPPRSEFFSWEVEEILKNLYEGDIWAHGGADKMNAQLDVELDEQHTTLDRDMISENEARAGDMYDSLAWKNKRRILTGMDLKPKHVL